MNVEDKKGNAAVPSEHPPSLDTDQGMKPTTESSKCSEDWQDIECYIQNYSTIAEWIRFADAKAAVLLTVSGAAAGFLIPTLKEVLANDATNHLIPFWRTIVLCFFALYVFLFLFSR